MGKRSLKASPEGQVKARQMFDRTRWTQEQLALEVGLNTRQSVWKFLTGRPIERHIFIDLCFQLNLDWEEIADLPPKLNASLSIKENNTDTKASAIISEKTEEQWLQQLRNHLQPSLSKQCGVLQSSLDRGVPLPLDQLYTPIRIVPHLRSKQWLEVNDLQSSYSQQQRIQLAQTYPESVDAIDMLQEAKKVLLLGKPGAGKTTFLQHLANRCIAGHYRSDCIPIFIPLRHGLFSSDENISLEQTTIGLFEHLLILFRGTELTSLHLQKLLQEGRFFLLLDGLDEVPSEESIELLKEIQSFTQKYPNNSCVITSRLTSNSPYLQGFLDVEVDNFSRDQIQIFAQQWFNANLPSQEAAHLKTKIFLESLDIPGNQPLKELMGTPILLSLLCSVFLARSNFPKKRTKLYQAGLDILLERWDKARGIQRDQTYYKLSIPEKLRLLGSIAARTFEKGHYFFEKSELLDIIVDYVKSLNDWDDTVNLEKCYLESEAILQAIQVQHGLLVERAKEVYSFSHLTFQEYLTARNIIYQTSSDSLTQTIQELAAHTLDSNWHEVLKLTANMMTVADPLLGAMHCSIQTLLRSESECQEYLQAIAQKVNSLQTGYSPAAVRAFYLTLFSDRDLRLANALDSKLAQTLNPDLSLDLTLARTFEIGLILLQKFDIKTMLTLNFNFELEQKFVLTPEFKAALNDLKQKLPLLDSDLASLSQWWEHSGKDWLETFRKILVDHRQIAQFQTLNSNKKKLLAQYYQLNLFLINCYQESQTTSDFTSELLAKLLLPHRTKAIVV
ncbi:NACHT domain-containing NTPase [Leptothoe sp. ISB3NOV94-8A]